MPDTTHLRPPFFSPHCVSPTDLQFQVILPSLTVTALPPELKIRISKYLSIVDLVNVCTALPNWGWLLFLQTPHSYSSKWRWIDKRVCTALFSESPTPSPTKFDEAIERHFYQMQFDLQFPRIRVLANAYINVNCFLYVAYLTYQSDDFTYFGVAPFPYEYGSDIFELVNFYFFKFPLGQTQCVIPIWVQFNLPDRRLSSAEMQNQHEEITELQRAELCPFDCILYTQRLSVLLQRQDNARRELGALLRLLTPQHTLAIAIVDDVEGRERSGMDLFVEYAKKLGFGTEAPLTTAPMNWRIWHVINGYVDHTGSREILEWLCQDVIWRRMQETVVRGVQRPSDVLQCVRRFVE
ncbi:unnamed protein product [Hydatigera taeniaeformis]|uniref:F-box domain-containing protein n=1 Tax=Hydatigena taeniaeformis TaxID=6205 RepID=A0A0R3XBP9_HYDTA|nr:unnamed protein product [Hydatigera taeniaeformis]